MLQLLEANHRIRKTREAPLRVSIIDTLAAITHQSQSNSHNVFQQLRSAYPEASIPYNKIKFPGRGQKETAVTDIEGINKIVRLLPGRRAARFREQLASRMEAEGTFLDAASILAERGCNPREVEHLAGEFGKDLLLICREEGQTPMTAEQQYGSDMKQVGQYSRRADGKLIEDVFQSFKERPLYQRVMQSNPETERRKRLLDERGRGRGHSSSAPRAKIKRGV